MLKKIIERFARIDREISPTLIIAALSKHHVDYDTLLTAPDADFFAEIYGAIVAYHKKATYRPRFPRSGGVRNKLLTAIPETHLDALAITAAEAGISLSELIRRILSDAASI